MKGPICHALALATLALTPACRSVGLTEAGFLSTYDALQADEDQRARESFVRSEAWPQTRQVFVEPLSLNLQASSLDRLNEKQETLLRGHFLQYVRESLGAEFELIAQPEDGAILVRAAVTEVDTTQHYLNWLTALLLWPLDTGGATLEVELLDASSGQQLAAMVNADKATVYNAIQSMTRIGHACQAVQETGHWVGQTIAAGQGVVPVPLDAAP